MPQTFDWKVREIAEDQGYNVSTLQRAADVSYNTIESLWKGKTERPDLRILKKIADVLGVGIRDLLPEDIETETK